MTDEEADKVTKAAVSLLHEHFDAVQVFVTWMPEDGSGETKYQWRGAGNYFARKQLATEFLREDEQKDLAEKIGAYWNEDDLEDWQRDE
jgi:hypothetical protein